MEYLADILIGLILCWVFYTDYTERRIPNTAVICVLVVAAWVHRLEPAVALTGFATVLLLFLPFALVGAYGAGDWKMSAALAGFAGFTGGLYIFVFSGIPAILFHSIRKQIQAKNGLSFWNSLFLVRLALQGQLRTAAHLSGDDRIPFGCWMLAGFVAWECLRRHPGFGSVFPGL
ncbi:MAG: prepilin peptidase [Solirubrobacterales bacterium]